MMSCRDTDEPPTELELFRRFFEQPNESSRDVTKTDEADRQFGIGHAGDAADADAGSVVSS
jgi:hypothetical protein